MPLAPVHAAGEGFTAVSNKAGKPGQDIEITDLQVSGTGDDQISVRLLVDSGEMYFNNESGVNFTTNSQGKNIAFNGSRSSVNNVLSTLMYDNDQEGTNTIDVVLGDGNYNAENGHVYQVVASEGITWANAKTAAEATTYGGVNGYLATITRQQEHDFIRERISDSGWIGANDSAVEGVWRWQTGPEAGTQIWAGDENGSAFGGAYNNWNDGEPNDGGEGEDCAQIWFSEGSDGQWNDLDCNSDQNQYYVVEFGGNTEESLPEITSTSFNVVLARDNISVNSCDQLFDLGAEHAGDNISLTADIDCQGRTEAPLFDEEDFSGAFEGNGFTIKNLVLANEDGSHVGLTGYSVGARYSNIFLDNITVTGSYHNGVLAGHVEDSITAENIHATNVTVRGTGDESVEQMGVLFGTVGLEHEVPSRIEHVSVQGTFDMSGATQVEGVGAIAGELESEGDLVIRQAYSDVDIIVDDSADASNIGGLVGYAQVDGQDNNEDKDVVQGISDSYSWGTISAPGAVGVGGLIGVVDVSTEDDADAAFNLNNVYSWMDITAGDQVGGLVGRYNSVSEGGNGGVYGYDINNSFYAGALTTDEGNSGIIVGEFEDFEEEFSSLSFDNVWYDAHKVAGYECVGNMSIGECNAANSGNSQPNYFYNNKTNAPMNEWNFDTIWKTNSGTPPVFKPFAGNDGDQDGANDYIETRAPNNGDANNDGTQDSEQSNVASFIDPITGNYAVLAVNDECAITSIAILAEKTDHKDAGYDYPAGLMDFELDCGQEGFTANVAQYYYGVSGDFIVRKFNPNTNTYTTISSASVADQTIAGNQVKVASYQVTDGGDLDLDGEVNGMIKDPAGLAFAVTGSSAQSQSPSDLASTGDNLTVISLVALALVVVSGGLWTAKNHQLARHRR
jgi:hypothetical protein